MSSDHFLDEKLTKKIDRKVQRLLDRVGVDLKTQDEVFDRSTLKTLEKLISDKVIETFDFPISTGKEGNVFRAVTPNQRFVAVKIYRTSTSTFKHIGKYIVGDPRFSSLHRTRRDIVFAWTKKEFKNLERLHQAGVAAPKPLRMLNNVLVMQYLGTRTRPAPMLKDVYLQDATSIYDVIIEFLTLMYRKAGIVHADLSPFNILIYRKKPYVIDLGQGVLLEHEHAHEFLKRDIHNIAQYFSRYGILTHEQKLYDSITKKKVKGT
jgi:RIO kinase 1